MTLPTKDEWILTLVLILLMAAMIAFSGCAQPEPINTEGFVTYQIDGDRVSFFIESSQPKCTITIDDGPEHIIWMRYYGCNSFPYEKGMVVELWSDSEWFKARI